MYVLMSLINLNKFLLLEHSEAHPHEVCLRTCHYLRIFRNSHSRAWFNSFLISVYCRRFRKFKITKDLASCFLCIILVSQILVYAHFYNLNVAFSEEIFLVTENWPHCSFIWPHSLNIYWIEHLHYFLRCLLMYSVLEGALFYIFSFASLRCSIK